MNTEQKCICLEDNKLTQALCPVHSKRHTEQKCCDHFKYNYYFKGCACTAMGQPCHTEQKGWRGVSTLAEDLHGRIALSWGNAEEVRSEIERFIERTLQEEREEMVRRIEALPRHLVERHATDPTIIGAVTLEDVRALIKDTSPLKAKE